MALKPGDMVIVESDLGLSIGKVVRKSMAPAAAEHKEAKEYKKVLRMASEEDIRESQANAGTEKEAFDFCRERVMARGLQMKLIRTEATLDRKRIIFYFISEKRIDFRELVKDLAQKFRTRIEMRQVGVRDEAKMTGGLGLCGRQLCCASFLSNFAPISIKMAKKQELVLNTGKLSGICGRLMCCLSYEYGNNSCRKEASEGEATEEKEIIAEVSADEAVTSGTMTKAEQGQKTPDTAHPERRREPFRAGKNPKKNFERRNQTQEQEPGPARRANDSRERGGTNDLRGRQGQQARGPRAQGRPESKAKRPHSGEMRPKDTPPQDTLHRDTGPKDTLPTMNIQQGPIAEGIASSDVLNAPLNAPSQDSQIQKKKKKKRWRKRGNKGNVPGNLNNQNPPQNPGPSGNPGV